MNDNMRSFVIGLLAGLAGLPVGWPEQSAEPVAYLYNSVQLPALPEWDKSKYPYAVIYKDLSTESYKLTIAPMVGVYAESTTLGTPKEIVFKAADGTGFDYLSTSVIDGTWADMKTNTIPEDTGMGVMLERFGNVLAEIVWTNTDILSENGTVCFAASEPVPVYE